VSTKPALKHRNSKRDMSQSELRRVAHDNTKTDSERRRTSAGERRYDGERCKGGHHRSRKVSFYDSTSSSESDSHEPSQCKQFMKAPKFDGSSMSFETFYAKFQICAKYNRWSKSEQLAFLSASLSGEAGQVL